MRTSSFWYKKKKYDFQRQFKFKKIDLFYKIVIGICLFLVSYLSGYIVNNSRNRNYIRQLGSLLLWPHGHNRFNRIIKITSLEFQKKKQPRIRKIISFFNYLPLAWIPNVI